MIVNLTGQLHSLVAMLYRIPSEVVATRLPAGLELRCRGPWAYVQIEQAQVHDLHVAGTSSGAASGSEHRWGRWSLHAQAMTDRIQLWTGLYVMHTACDPELIGRFGTILASWRLDARGGDSPLAFPLGVEPEANPDTRRVDSTFAFAWQAWSWMTRATRTLAPHGRAWVQCTDLLAERAFSWQPVRRIDPPACWPAGLSPELAELEAAVALASPTPVRWRAGHVERLLQPGCRGVMDGRCAGAESPRRRLKPARAAASPSRVEASTIV